MGDALETLDTFSEGEVLDPEVAAAQETALIAYEGTLVQEGEESPNTELTGTNLPVPAQAAMIDRMEHAQLLAQLAFATARYPNHTEFELAMKVLIGQDLGLEPATSLDAIVKIAAGFHISAELQRALARRAGYRIKQIQLTDEICELALMSDDLSVEYGRSTYTLDDAKVAKLLGNEVWHKHRKRMLLARCSDTLVTTFCPEVKFFRYGGTL